MKDRHKMLAATGIMVVIIGFASSYAGFVALIISLILAQTLEVCF